ncbi:unnamed protein product [Phytomonas sp. EM1]|nr:unnamed protein product [Phytomonas sp. EM1]|eukprot:CCW65420.1 unnamed protein product [Phytomonas sp. isolate EM1]
MPWRSNAKVKRDADSKQPAGVKVDGKKSGESSGAAGKGETWSSVEHSGSVLSWLEQKVKKSKAQPSRGAVEYLSKAMEKKKVTDLIKVEKPAATSKPAEEPGKIPKPRSKRADPADSDVAVPTKSAVQKLADMFPEVNKSAPHAGAGKPSMERGAAEAPGEEGKEKSSLQHPQRGVRGRRRRDDPHRRLQQRLAKEQEAAQRAHEEAMANDPEYKKCFLSFQEVQQAMLRTQQKFFGEYGKQENITISDVVVERLDMPVILDLIEQHHVVFICTDTGSGKSTGIPKALLELSPHTRVVSTQPRRTATIAIANRVASLRRENVGEDVGYWIRGEKRGDEQTRLWYMTSYTLLLRLLESPAEVPFTHIVLDEFHERQPDLEVTVALLRLMLAEGLASFKLILMSATLNTESWEEYFTGLKVATYKQSEPEHPIHDYFLEDCCALLGVDHAAPPRLLRTEAVDRGLVEKHLCLLQNLIVFLNNASNPTHSILAFLPGRAQVEMVQSWLEANLPQRVDVVPWHSAIELSQIEAAMKRRVSNRQKIYLATDIAEVSITLPDVVFVIDLALVKRPKINVGVPASILYPPLVMQWISKVSITQRRGRVGRVQQGFYFCFFPSSQVVDLPDHAQPPIENSRIDDLSLHCMQVVANPVAIFSLCHGQPHLETIASSMNVLTELGCILDVEDPLAAGERIPRLSDHSARWSERIVASAKQGVTAEITEYTCTFLGRMLQLMPVSPPAGMLVFFGFLTGLESLMILAAAVVSSLSPFTVGGGPHRRGGKGPFKLARAMEETENVMRGMSCEQRSDIVAVMKATLLFRLEMERHVSNPQAVHQWCLQKHLSFEKLQAIVDLESHIKFELADFMPFRDIHEAGGLLEQLDKLAPMVVVMTSVAFVAQALEVRSEGNTYTNSQEMALGLFSDLSAMPDIHSPSCLRWREEDIIIPIQLNLFYDKLLASFSTAISSPKQFWMSLLLFSTRLHYATFSDHDGAFHVFKVIYCGRERFVEVDGVAGYVVVEFRRKLCNIFQLLRLTWENKEMFDDGLEQLLAEHGLKPLPETQREIITALVSIFKNLDNITAEEVEHDGDDLDIVSFLSFSSSKVAA